jgi:hypothetical protein
MALALLVLVACSSHKPGPTKNAFLTPEPSASVTLSFDRATEAIHLHFDGNGLRPTAVYTLQMSANTCLKPGSLLAMAGSFTASATGVANADLKADRAFRSGIPKGIHVDLRTVTGSTISSVPTACADVSSRKPTAPARFFQPPTLRAGGSFTATFKDARTLSLRINLVGVKQGEHAVRIYSGSCASQGAVDTSLGDMDVNAGGSASLARNIRLSSTSGSMYVGVSFGSSQQVSPGTDPVASHLILCGDLPSRPAR